MKLLFASILFCLLLLPGVGSGQGIEINESSQRNQSLTFENRYQLRGMYKLKNANVYTKNKVRSLELFQHYDGLCLMLKFDNKSKIIKRKNIEHINLSIITDSIFETNKITVIDSFFDRNGVFRIDTFEIEKTENLRRNNKNVCYDKVQYKSYKKGWYLNERSRYYKDLLHSAYPCYTTRVYLDHGNYTPPRRIDGNFSAHYRRRIKPAKKPLSNRKAYQSEKLYLTQTKTDYINITGASKNKISSLAEKNIVKYRVRGENFDEKDYCFEFGSSMNCGGRRESWQLTPISTEKQTKNEKGLIDTIFTITYYEQAKDKPCVKPADINFTQYLKGYSGVPVKSIQYYFRYEYFDQ